MVKTILQSDMSRGNDRNYDIYLWSQFEHRIIRSKVLRQSGENVDSQDSDNDILEADIIDAERSRDPYTVHFATGVEQVEMIQGEHGFLYYLTKSRGNVEVNEGNPRDPYFYQHECIFSMKANQCLAFSLENQSTFFLMDETHIVYKLVRSDSSR